jgi:hypothetical protein
MGKGESAMGRLGLAALAGAVVLSASLAGGQASAMPLNGLASARTQLAGSAQDVRVVCGPNRCWVQGHPHWDGFYYPPYAYWHHAPWGWDWHHYGMHPWGWGW